MTKKTILTISAKDKLCPIFFLEKKLELITEISSLIKDYSLVFVITDTNVFEAQSDFFAEFPAENVFVFPAGESSKTLETVYKITEQMASVGMDRKSVLLGIGGGVTTDLTGFAGNIYQRGIDTVLMPTSLLAMVDASVGGKTGVDTPWGKNQLGTFYFPKNIYVCAEFLATLPESELRNGLAEMIKHGIIASEKHFNTIDSLISAKFSWGDIVPLIADSIQIKINVVEKDSQEKSGERAKLNLGHTFAHAIETDSQFTIPHGHAVAIGLRLAAKFGVEKGITEDAVADQITHVVQKLFPEKNSYDVQKLWQHMGTDKKRDGTEINFVLPKKIGEVCLHPVLISDVMS